ncbi:dehydration-induced 19-like protein, partial [Genlisea aurea]
ICPVCAMRVGVDMVAHITVQHSNIFKLKRKSRKAFANSTLSLFKKEMREANFRSLFGGSSRSTTSSTSVTADPLLSSFILPMVEEGEGTQSNPVMEPAKKIAADITSERIRKSSAMSMKDKEEKSKRCKFVQDLVFSAVLDDN